MEKTNKKVIVSRPSGASIAFARMNNKGSFRPAIVYIEGDSDLLLYKHLVDRKYVKLSPTDGKVAAMKSVDVANRSKTRGVLAIVDSDFDNILQIGPDNNVVRTDTHDIETLMIQAGAFQYAPDGYLDLTKLKQSNYDEESLWNRIIEISCQIGKIRLLSQEKNWNINFSYTINSKDFLEDERVLHYKNGMIDFDAHEYIYRCISVSSNCSATVAEVYRIFKDDSRIFDWWQLCRGHDLSLLFSIVYSRDFLGKNNVSKREIENIIRSTYLSSNKFKKTKMCQEIKKWQIDNLGYKILNDKIM